jgi:hypothetical protein
MNAARRVLTKPTLRKIQRAHGLRGELAAAKWLLRAYRQQDKAHVALETALQERVDKLTADQVKDEARIARLVQLNGEIIDHGNGLVASYDIAVEQERQAKAVMLGALKVQADLRAQLDTVTAERDALRRELQNLVGEL